MLLKHKLRFVGPKEEWGKEDGKLNWPWFQEKQGHKDQEENGQEVTWDLFLKVTVKKGHLERGGTIWLSLAFT